MVDLNKTLADFEAAPSDDVGFCVTSDVVSDMLDGNIKNLPPIKRKHTIIYDAMTENYLIVAGDLLDERIKARS